MEPFKLKTKRQLSCFDLHSNVVAGLTTRNGGYSENPYDSLNMGLHVKDEKEIVIRNRERLAEDLDIPLNQWVIGEQIHGTAVETVSSTYAAAGTRSQDTAVKGVDGLISNKPNILLAAFFADCVPLYFYDPTADWVGIAHAGWKGTVNGMAGKMVDALAEQGCKKESIEIVIGPSIGMGHYEVDQKVIDHIPSKFHDACIIEKGEGKYQLDLKSLHMRMLLEKGIPAEKVRVSGYCTYKEEELFYSHRRDQGKTGRMLGFIGLKT